MFDIELCPLPFSMEEMFGFISCRFSGYPASVQEQALLWLHVSAWTRTQTHKHTHTLPGMSSRSLCPVKFPQICLQRVLIEQVVPECGKLGRDPAENGSGSQIVRERGGVWAFLPSVDIACRNGCTCCYGGNCNEMKRKSRLYQWWIKGVHSFSLKAES